mgnify:CR=1 FL=1
MPGAAVIARESQSACGGPALLTHLYNWTMGLARHRHALPALALVSFAESSFFPIPPDVLLVPMVVANRARAWLIATVCTVASVAGGALGYAIGFFLFEVVGRPLVAFYGYGEKFTVFKGRGCPACRNTGLKGRVGIFEVMAVDEKIRHMVTKGVTADEVGKQAQRDGMLTLRQAAIKKMALGLTSFEEVLRVTAEAGA